MITAEDVNDMPTSKQEPASCAAPNSDKVCPSPCSSASPSPSPSAMKSSGESATMTSSSGDECEGAPCPRNGIGDSTLHGVLTPPNDGESQCGSGVVDDGSKQFRYNGRLEFYKEGVLCLELSHCEEGEGRKWLKTKGRSDKRQIVRVSKEVSIPCPSSSSPSLHLGNHPPNGLFTPQDNLSDEGSSAASSTGSPKSRDKCWRKQTVPQKSISKSLEFFMRPSVCIHLLPKSKNMQDLNPRRPYALPQFDQWTNEGMISGHVCNCGQSRVRNYFSPNRKTVRVKAKIREVATKLRAECERNPMLQRVKNNLKGQSSRCMPQKIQSSCSSARKRSSRDMSGNECELTPIKAKKKSPIKNLEKTILSVPGIGTSPKNSGTRPPSQSGNRLRPIVPNFDSIDGKGNEPRHSPPSYDHKKYAKTHQLQGEAQKSPSSSVLSSYPEIKHSPSPEAGNEESGEEQEEIQLSPEQQQQVAMSRAIFHTITSLLSQPNAVDKKQVDFPNPNYKLMSNNPSSSSSPAMASCNSFGHEQDKNSFLRHLLDTSEPLPNSTHLSVMATASISFASPPVQKPNFSPEKTQKSRNFRGKRNTKSPYLDSSDLTKMQKRRPNSADCKIVSDFGSSHNPTSVTAVPSHSYSPYLPPNGPLDTLAGASVQYASHVHPHFIPLPTLGSKVPFSHTTTHPPPRVIPITSKGSYSQTNEVPINLSQKDGDWPETKNFPLDRASRTVVEGPAFPIVPHANPNEESDPDLPLDLCKKRRDD